MKQKILFCTECKKYTPHRCYKDNENIVARLFFGLATMGLAEMVNDTNYECLECGQLWIE
jgi:hypothetical protein